MGRKFKRRGGRKPYRGIREILHIKAVKIFCNLVRTECILMYQKDDDGSDARGISYKICISKELILCLRLVYSGHCNQASTSRNQSIRVSPFAEEDLREKLINHINRRRVGWERENKFFGYIREVVTSAGAKSDVEITGIRKASRHQDKDEGIDFIIGSWDSAGKQVSTPLQLKGTRKGQSFHVRRYPLVPSLCFKENAGVMIASVLKIIRGYEQGRILHL